MRNEIQLRVPHGVLFAYDPQGHVVIPDDTGAGPITATSSCLAVWTKGEDDGDVRVLITNELKRLEQPKVFAIALDTPNRRLAILTSQCDVLFEIEVASVRTLVEVRANDPKYPDLLEFAVVG